MPLLLLINPVGRKSGYLLSRFTTFSPLALAYVAALTPPKWEVKIIDENFGKFEFEEADLVAITAFTSNINRAYEIAKIYREKKIKVVIGGIHASMATEEALQYADTVVVGEAEGIWPEVIQDFENNNLNTIYRGPRVDLNRTYVFPRRELLDPRYLWSSVQTSRGCPFNCNFCSVTRHLGKEFRQRRTEDVLNELENIQGEYVAFIDDNLIGYSPANIARAKDLFKGMIDLGLGKKWWMQTSINAVEDEQTIELAAKAGCMFVFIGFETLNKKTLTHMKKGVNLKIGTENYKKVVNIFHKYGIAVFGAFIIGNDFESPDYYKELGDFMVQSGIDIFQISLLTPLPGTKLMEQLQNDGRLTFQNFPGDWDKYRLSYLVHQPEGVDSDTIYTADNYIKKRLYSFPNYHSRIFKSALQIRKPRNVFCVLKFNQALKKSWQNSQYYQKYPFSF